MVKKAEVKRKRPLLPALGAILAAGMFGIAYLISDQFVMHMPQVVNTIDIAHRSLARVGFAIGIWFVFVAVGVFLVAMLAGRDPEDAKQIPLPVRQKDMKKKKR